MPSCRNCLTLKMKALQSFRTPETPRPKSQHHIPAGQNCHVQFTDDINHVFKYDHCIPTFFWGGGGSCNIPQVHQSVSVKVHPVAPQSPPFQPPGHVNCKYTTQIKHVSLNDIILNCLPLWYRVLWSIWISYELQYHTQSW